MGTGIFTFERNRLLWMFQDRRSKEQQQKSREKALTLLRIRTKVSSLKTSGREESGRREEQGIFQANSAKPNKLS
jgi:hypothetical protein